MTDTEIVQALYLLGGIVLAASSVSIALYIDRRNR